MKNNLGVRIVNKVDAILFTIVVFLIYVFSFLLFVPDFIFSLYKERLVELRENEGAVNHRKHL